ncbi:C40 family peptidase [Nitrobacteraceae bacterium UC4446_H13]
MTQQFSEFHGTDRWIEVRLVHPGWSRDYVGVPWQFAGRSRAGVDCWGLLWLIYRDILGIEIASYAQETMDAPEREQIAALMAGELVKSPWLDVQPGTECPFDMLVFRRAGIDSHVGIAVEPGRMLHITHGTESRVERYDQGRWKHKLLAIHRHESR